MTENDCPLIDSNVLIYAYDETESEKHKKAKEIMNLAWSKQRVLAFSTQNLSEFFSVITTKIQKPVELKIAFRIISDISYFSFFKIFKFSTREILDAILFVEKFKIDYWDALIVAVMHKNNIHTIITENESDFKKIPWLTVINPFK